VAEIDGEFHRGVLKDEEPYQFEHLIVVSTSYARAFATEIDWAGCWSLSRLLNLIVHACRTLTVAVHVHHNGRATSGGVKVWRRSCAHDAA